MRKYSLASSEHRENTNLKSYSNLIKKTIREVCPDIKVTVEEDGFLLPDDISRGSVIRIGRALAHTKLGTLSTNRPILFVGKKVIQQKNMETTVREKKEQLDHKEVLNDE